MSAKRYAIVNNGVAEQITLWDPDAAPFWRPVNGGVAVPCQDDTQIGATYDGQTFNNPPQHPSQPEQDPVGPDNLTNTERATLKALAAKVAG